MQCRESIQQESRTCKVCGIDIFWGAGDRSDGIMRVANCQKAKPWAFGAARRRARGLSRSRWPGAFGGGSRTTFCSAYCGTCQVWTFKRLSASGRPAVIPRLSNMYCPIIGAIMAEEVGLPDKSRPCDQASLRFALSGLALRARQSNSVRTPAAWMRWICFADL